MPIVTSRDLGGTSNLKDQVLDTLESRGVLGKLRAHVRASVFSAVHDDDNSSRGARSSVPVTQTAEAALLADLVREYLIFHGLEYTDSVFVPEAHLAQGMPSRNELAGKLNLAEGTSPQQRAGPLLLDMLKSFLKPQPAPISNAVEESFEKRPPIASTTAPSEEVASPNSVKREIDAVLKKDNERRESLGSSSSSSISAMQPASVQAHDDEELETLTRTVKRVANSVTSGAKSAIPSILAAAPTPTKKLEGAPARQPELFSFSLDEEVADVDDEVPEENSPVHQVAHSAPIIQERLTKSGPASLGDTSKENEKSGFKRALDLSASLGRRSLLGLKKGSDLEDSSEDSGLGMVTTKEIARLKTIEERLTNKLSGVSMKMQEPTTVSVVPSQKKIGGLTGFLDDKAGDFLKKSAPIEDAADDHLSDILEDYSSNSEERHSVNDYSDHTANESDLYDHIESVKNRGGEEVTDYDDEF